MRRWRWLWASVAATILCGSWIAWRTGQPEFEFLAGRKLLWPVQDVPEIDPKYFGFPPQEKFEAVYGFKADSKQVIKAADKQLLAAGWTKETSAGWTGTNVVFYSEPGGLDRVVKVECDCSVPSTGTSDLITLGQYRQGWTGVTIVWPNTPRDWRTRATLWLHKVFLGQP